MGETIRLGISSCLLGHEVRYDGGHRLDRRLREVLGPCATWVPVCPEVECGLPVPRDPLRLVGDPGHPRLVVIRTGIDHTAALRTWAERRLRALEREDLSGFIFKARSPSCGLRDIGTFDKAGRATAATGVGIFARAFLDHFPGLPVEDEDRLADPVLRERFIERAIFVARRRRTPRGTAAADHAP